LIETASINEEFFSYLDCWYQK